ncbi:hypothetical protein BRARA_A01659 [Brassica rapa]|uniref:STAR protein homodimerisation region domain-containing protein n=2 Tax=Brassica TaxID=3705 RepID=A0ABQ8EMR3_BRANA|nr:hypothetical protein HID58_001630 [Brassica napus]RID78877.1 hypothetical protein BRARA_A01659 [Brassica rapa]
MMESGEGFAAMEERILPGSFSQFPLPASFSQLMPHCCRLLNQEIRRLSIFSDLDIYEPGSPFRSLGPALTNGKLDFEIARHYRRTRSVKDTVKEEKLKGKQCYKHLSEPLHLLIEAELTENIINSRLEHAVHFLESLLKPVDKSIDHYKREQLKELGALNGTLREESPSLRLSPCLSPSMSPFNSKRAKT